MPAFRYGRRILKWGSRFLGAAVLLIALVVARINVAKIEPASERRGSAVIVMRVEDWPLRSEPKMPELELISGPGPVDKGAFKNCRVLFVDNAEGTDSYCLVTSLLPRHKATMRGEMNFNTAGRHASKFKLKCENQLLLLGWVMPATSEPIGTLLYLSGIDVMSSLERKLLDAARGRGWHVVSTSVDLSFSSSQRLMAEASGEEQLASRIDNHLAERAYAMEAMLEFLQMEQPDLLSGPRVLVGMSAGAIAAPAVAARLGQLDAAVLIGAGENVAEIMLRSPLFREHTILERAASPGPRSRQPRTERVRDPELRKAFAERTHRRCRLDPSRMASSLAGVPALLVHARYDKIVPASTGEAFYSSMSRPERWTYSTGHLGLCVLLSWKSSSILDWIEQQVLD